MAASLSDLEQQARTLSPDDRARLAEILLESLQDTSLSDIEAAWNAEIEQRVAAYDRGELETFSAEVVFAEARRLAR
jgi:putative addiction module component (TIGR02574 family)